jgi:hypothetical protein
VSASAEAASALIEDVQAEAEADVVAEQPDLAPEPEAEAEVPTLDPQLPPDISALLEPDEQDDVPDEFVDEPEPSAEVEEWEDPGVLRRQYDKLAKRTQFLEKQNLKALRPQWETEITQYFPLADAKEIAGEATSRRAALQAASEQHSTAKRGAEKIAAHYEVNIEKIVEERIAQEREKLHAQWGNPIGGPGVAPVVQGDRAAKSAEVQQARTLHERLLAKMRNGDLAPELTVTEGGE